MPSPGRTMLEEILLGGMRAVEGSTTGMWGTPVKLYNDVVQRGRRDPITEKDFTPNELGELAGIVRNKGGQSGHIDYKDYPSVGWGTQALGGFNYAVAPGGDINITDTYDFNRDRGSSIDNDFWAQLLALWLAPRNLAAKVGRDTVPDGQGVPVNVNIPWLR